MAEAPAAGRDHVTEMNKNRADKGGRERKMAPTEAVAFTCQVR